ncbi:DinB family protein [Paenibacillus sp. FSL H8-0048]|uniref:DinB family protein n=1 Tax=Paenibacillus sp. FSL H8-0048 TaxID=2954508 RepID=UPI0030F836CF
MNTEQRNHWNRQHKMLSRIITNPKAHTEAVAIILELHTALFASEESNGQQATYEDTLWDTLLESTARSYPVQTPGSRNSIVWHLWHSARIEDITMNILGADCEQVLYSGQYARRLEVPYVHSGNGMSEQDVAALSREVNLGALTEYRRAVARRTRSILSSLEPGQLGRKATPAQFERVREEKAVLDSEQWLMDYWGGKTFAGHVLMPATRHNFVHLNKAIQVKQKLQK